MKPLQIYVIKSLFEQNQMSADRFIRGLSFVPTDLLDQILTKLVDDVCITNDNHVTEETEEGYGVYLHKCDIGYKVHAIAVIKDFLGIGLKEAKDLVNSCPVVIRYDSKVDKKPSRRWFTLHEANMLLIKLKEGGRDIKAYVKPASELPV